MDSYIYKLRINGGNTAKNQLNENNSQQLKKVGKMNTMQNDFNKAFNGANIERTYCKNASSGLIVGKRDISPTGNKYVVTHYCLGDNKFSFFWSTYDIETLAEACLIAEAKL